MDWPALPAGRGKLWEKALGNTILLLARGLCYGIMRKHNLGSHHGFHKEAR
jgi:hypothetical protein